jgi:hypothetical protein
VTRVIKTKSLKLIFVTHLFDKINFTLIICKHFHTRLECTTVVKVSIFPTTVPSYGKNVTCDKIAISCIELNDTSK